MKRRLSFGREGSILLETVFAIPLLFILMMLVLQFAMVWTARHVVAYSAYCAARATLSVKPSEKQKGAEAAVDRVLGWINGASSEPAVAYGADPDTINPEDLKSVDDGVGNEIKVPGWGSIPGSGTVASRRTVDLSGSQETKCAVATVTYKYAMMVPVANAMLSWFAANPSDTKATIVVARGWTGEKELYQNMPYITLKETCVVPMPYSSADYPSGGYK